MTDKLFSVPTLLILGLVAWSVFFYVRNILRPGKLGEWYRERSFFFYAHFAGLSFLLTLFLTYLLNRFVGASSGIWDVLNLICAFLIVLFIFVHPKSPANVKFLLHSPIVCPACLKSVDPLRKWTCPFCNEANDSNILVAKCKKCKDRLPAYECPHCRSEIDFNVHYDEKALKRKRHE